LCKLGCECRQTLHTVLAEAVFDNDISALDIAKLAQAFLEPRQFRRMTGRSAWEYPADLRNVRWLLLRTRRTRSRGNRAAQQRDEFAPFQLIELHPLAQTMDRQG
jgi:hypothetical protein